MEYVIVAVILAVVIYLLTRKKKEKPPIEPPIEEQKEDKKEVIVKPLPTEQKVYWVKDGKKEWGRMKYMPQGLQVFDENGEVMLDMTDTLTSVAGEIVCDKVSGELYVPGLNGRKIWLIEKDSEIIRENNKHWYKENPTYYPVYPKVTVEGDYIKWEYPKLYVFRRTRPDSWTLMKTEINEGFYGCGININVTYYWGVI